MIKRINRLGFLVFALSFFSSCNTDVVEIPEKGTGVWKATIVAGGTMDADKHYNTVGIKVDTPVSANTILLTTDCDWLNIKSDTLPSDGYFDVLPESNTSVEDREAKLTLTSQADGSAFVLSLIQKGSVGYNDDASSDYKLGRGFSCFDEYMSANSVRKTVISEAKLRALDSDSTFISIQEAVRGEIYYEFVSAYSMSEMQKTLTEKSNVSTNFLGFKKTVERYKNVSTAETNEQFYGYARMLKTVASCSMDEGALKYVLNNKDMIENHNLPFDDDFYLYYDSINASTGLLRTALIERMIQMYGTHIVVQASLGGAIDLVTTFSRNLSSSLEEATETVFKNTTGTKSSSNFSQSLLSSLNGASAINISGGDSLAREALANDVKNLTGDNSLSDTLWNQWLSSITYASVFDTEKRKNLGAVNFSFIPIWDLFADKEVRVEILSAVVALAESQKNIFSDKELGIDNYELTLTKEMMEFDSKNTISLVRVLCVNDVPVAELCNEYVPSIRSDKRITVIYPIVNGITRITMGLFPGDGENRPAYLTFSDGSVYVDPLDGYSSSVKLDKIYCLHGSLYPSDMGIPTRDAQFAIKEHYLRFENGSNKYPVVKIGNGYWTRCDIQEYMDWGYTDMYGVFRYVDEVVDGYEFALIYYTQAQSFMALNQLVYDNQEHPINGRDRWYVPRISDKKHLTDYLGHNHKSMLQGQQSGFEARFLGRCTDINPETGEELVEMQRVDEGKRCYVVFKNVDTKVTAEKVTGASVLVLNPDYTWETLSDEEARFYYYPVRLFRTNYYNYSLYGI